MKQPSDQLKLGAILSYVSTGLNMAVQLLYTPLMIRLLGQSEYGLYTLVGSVVSYLSLFSLGFTGAYLRFYSQRRAKNDEEGIARLNGMFLTVFCVMSLAALVCGMVLLRFPRALFGNKLTAREVGTARILMAVLVVNIALTFPAGLLESMVTAREKFLFQQLVTLASVLFNPLLCLPLLLMGFGSVAVVGVTTFLTVAKLVVSAWYCVKKLHIRFRFDGFDFGVLREIAGFSFFLFLNMLINQINWSVDKYILGRVSGTEAVAVYGVGAQINSLFISFSTAISAVFAPRVHRIAADGDPDKAGRFSSLLLRVGRVQYLILTLIASGFVVFGRYFITDIYATPAYAQAYPVALLLILPALVPLIQNLGIEIQRAMNQHRFRSVIYSLMAGVNILVSIPLAKRYGPPGAALGTTISLIVGNGLIMNVFYARKLGLDIAGFWKSIARLSLGLAAPAVLGACILRFVHFGGIWQFLAGILLYTAVYCASMWLVGMNEEEKQLVRRPLQKIIGRLRHGGNH